MLPSLKGHTWLIAIGFAIVVGGNFIRDLAMWTCRTNFNLHIEMSSEKREDHKLITTGIYRQDLFFFLNNYDKVFVTTNDS